MKRNKPTVDVLWDADLNELYYRYPSGRLYRICTELPITVLDNNRRPVIFLERVDWQNLDRGPWWLQQIGEL